MVPEVTISSTDIRKEGDQLTTNLLERFVVNSFKGMMGDAGEKNKEDGLFHHLAKRFFVCAGISFAEADGLDRGIKD